MRFYTREIECNFGPVRHLAGPEFSYGDQRQEAGCSKTGPIFQATDIIVTAANGSSTSKLNSPYHFLAASSEVHYVVEADRLCN